VVLKTPGFFTAKYTKYAKFYLHDRMNKICRMELPGKPLLPFLIFGIFILFILFILSKKQGTETRRFRIRELTRINANFSKKTASEGTRADRAHLGPVLDWDREASMHRNAVPPRVAAQRM
jgi:hypothetical protein